MPARALFERCVAGFFCCIGLCPVFIIRVRAAVSAFRLPICSSVHSAISVLPISMGANGECSGKNAMTACWAVFLISDRMILPMASHVGTSLYA